MSDMPQVKVQDLDDQTVLLDVREHDEFDAGHAVRAIHIPLGEVPQRLAEVPEERPLYVICKAGGRSARAVAFLREQGIDAVNVEGGTAAWAQAGKEMSAEHNGEPVVL